MALPTEFEPGLQRYSELRFCPRCGTAYGSGDFKPAEVLFMCASCGYDFYQNPPPAAVVAIADPGDAKRILMLKRRTPPNAGRWCVPGGFIRYGEVPAAAAARRRAKRSGSKCE